MTEQITLYSAKVCPFAHRVEIALKESKLDHARYEIDLKNKPEWYAPQVNPVSKVPAIAYGGPKVAPDQPSSESQKIAESLVLLEFVADLSGNLLPKNPVERAKARFFIDAVSQTFVPAFFAVLLRGEPIEKILNAIEAIQNLLPEAGYAVGDFSIADAAIIPFLARLEVALREDIGMFKEGSGPQGYEVLDSDPKYTRYRQYIADVKARDSFTTTFDEEYTKSAYGDRFIAARAEGRKFA